MDWASQSSTASSSKKVSFRGIFPREPVPGRIAIDSDSDSASDSSDDDESVSQEEEQQQEVLTGTADRVTPARNTQHNLSLADEVQALVAGTSGKCVPPPRWEDIASDAFIALRRFIERIRWKEFFREEEKKKRGINGVLSDSESIDGDPDDNPDNNKGLNTGLRPTTLRMDAPHGTPRLELFLKDLEKGVLDQVWQHRGADSASPPTTTSIRALQRRLRADPTSVVVPTDKTNSYQLVSLQLHVDQVQHHLQLHGKAILPARLVEVQNQAWTLLEDIKPILSPKEAQFIDQSIKSKAIPTPKLLIKDHKDPDALGHYPTRLIVPASNFVSAFPKMGYLGIKRIMDANRVAYDSKTIIQASDLKTKLETLHLSAKNCTIISLDAQDYYPSIQFKLVKKAVEFYSQHLPPDQQIKIQDCLAMTRFGMTSTYLTFLDQYYEYDGDQDPDEKGLTIGGYESAWLADLVGAHILEEAQAHFVGTTRYHGMHRDDGLVVFKGKKKYDEVAQWMEEFQTIVNDTAGGDYLQYTCVIWLDERVRQPPNTEGNDKVTVETGPAFPYLDMELFWARNSQLRFRVHLKPNQHLKYLNADSTHTRACFRAIPTGVCHRLAKLTTATRYNKHRSMDQLYPKHFQALDRAGLLTESNMGPIPTLAQAQATLPQPSRLTPRERSQRARDAKRTTYFCIGKSAAYKIPIWKLINDLKAKHNLGWIRVSMSYHRFSNLRELFNGDLSGKLNAGIFSKDFMARPCNCSHRATEGCSYDNICRDTMMVHKIHCKITGKAYIGATQNTLKQRMKGHHNDVQALHLRGRRSDTYAEHFQRILSNFPRPTPRLQRTVIECQKLWQGDPLSAVKTFGTHKCALCNAERLEIFKFTRLHPHLLINNCNELYGACRHKPQFHRCMQAPLTSTDES